MTPPEKKQVEFEVQPYLLYMNDKPIGIVAGKSEEQVIAGYRAMNLGKLGATDLLRAVPTMTAPFEDFMRTAMNGIYLQMIEAKMAGMGRRH